MIASPAADKCKPLQIGRPAASITIGELAGTRGIEFTGIIAQLVWNSVATTWNSWVGAPETLTNQFPPGANGAGMLQTT